MTATTSFVSMSPLFGSVPRSPFVALTATSRTRFSTPDHVATVATAC